MKRIREFKPDLLIAGPAFNAGRYVVPLDVMRELEKEGLYGRLHSFLYTTTGTGTAVAFAEKFGREIGEKLKNAGGDAAILTST